MKYSLAGCTAAGLWLAAALVSAPVPADPPGPAYSVEACCQLCPKAADPANYVGSGYRAGFKNLLQGRSGWLFRSEFDLATSFGLNENEYHELHRFSEALKKRGTQLVLVYAPPRGLMDPDKLLPDDRQRYDFALARSNFGLTLQRFEQQGGVVAPHIEQLADEGKGYEYFFRRDHHWTPTGAEHTAQVVAKAIQESIPAYATIPKRQFVTRRVGTLQKPGSIGRFATQICGFSYPMQYTDAFSTEPEGENSPLGDASAPQIVLVGTSLSNANVNFNFVGYLTQYLSADVLNAAVSGGGYDTAMLQFLHSEQFQKEPPKILIWETPYYDFNGDSTKYLRFLRQAIPAVTGGCGDKPALLSATVNLQAGNNEILFNGGGRILPIVSRKHTVEMQFSDPTLRELWAKVYYLNGVKERLHLRYGQYYKGDGRFTAELRHDTALYADATFMALNLELAQAPAAPLSVTARICESDEDAPPLPQDPKALVPKSQVAAR